MNDSDATASVIDSPSGGISSGIQLFGSVPHILAESTIVNRPPINEFDALMRCAPGDTPEQTMEEHQEVRNIVVDAIDLLDPRQRFMIEAIHAERISYDDLAYRLSISKTQAWRLVKQAEAALREALATQPIIRGRIHMYSTWNEAARSAAMSICPSGSNNDTVALGTINRKINELRTMVRTLTIDEATITAKMRTIGFCAATILSNAGAWSVDEMVDLLVRKQNDYGHDNINSFGLIGVVVRTSDKVARYNNLAGKAALAEPRVDALVDLVGYAVIAVMLEDGTFNLQLEEVAA